MPPSFATRPLFMDIFLSDLYEGESEEGEG